MLFKFIENLMLIYCLFKAQIEAIAFTFLEKCKSSCKTKYSAGEPSGSPKCTTDGGLRAIILKAGTLNW
jgi:hypothetical protein